MDSNKENSDSKKKRKIRLSAKISLTCAIIGLICSAIMSMAFYINCDFMDGEIKGPNPFAGLVAEVLFSVSVYVIGIAFFLAIFVVFASFFLEPIIPNFIVGLSGLLIAFIALQIFNVTTKRVRASPLRWCVANMRHLSYEIERHAEQHNGQLPPAEHWRETLVEPNSIFNHLRCPIDAPKGLSSYALNENLTDTPLADIPGNVVLLFETAPGKNPVGGRELITAKHHYGKGAMVLFANLHIEFVKTADFNDLRWQP